MGKDGVSHTPHTIIKEQGGLGKPIGSSPTEGISLDRPSTEKEASARQPAPFSTSPRGRSDAFKLPGTQLDAPVISIPPVVTQITGDSVRIGESSQASVELPGSPAFDGQALTAVGTPALDQQAGKAAPDAPAPTVVSRDAREELQTSATTLSTRADLFTYTTTQTSKPAGVGQGVAVQQLYANAGSDKGTHSSNDQAGAYTDNTPAAAGGNYGNGSGTGGGTEAAIFPDGDPDENSDPSNSPGGKIPSPLVQRRIENMATYLRDEEAAGRLKRGDPINWDAIAKATGVKPRFIGRHRKALVQNGDVATVRGVGSFYQEAPPDAQARPPKRQPVDSGPIKAYFKDQVAAGALQPGDSIDIDAISRATGIRRNTVIKKLLRLSEVVSMRGVGRFYQEIPLDVKPHPPGRVSKEQPKVKKYLAEQITAGTLNPGDRIDWDVVARATGVHRVSCIRAGQTMDDIIIKRGFGSFYLETPADFRPNRGGSRRRTRERQRVIAHITEQITAGTLNPGDRIDWDIVARATGVNRITAMRAGRKMFTIVPVRGVGSFYQEAPPDAKAKPPVKISKEQERVKAHLTEQITSGILNPGDRIDWDTVERATEVDHLTALRAGRKMPEIISRKGYGSFYLEIPSDAKPLRRR